MSTRLYKVAQEFEHEGNTLKIGTEIVLKERDGEALIKKQKLVEGRYLDPADPDDEKMIKEAEKKHKVKYDANAEREKERSVGKKTRDEAKDKKEADELAKKEEAMAAEADAKEETTTTSKTK